MAHDLQTKRNFGEEEGSDANLTQSSSDAASAAPPSLKDALSSFPAEYSKLVEQGVTELKDMLYLNDKELEEVCSEIGLSGMKKLKFKSNMRSLQREYARPLRNDAPIVAISMQEQRDMERMQFAVKEAGGAQALLEKHLGQIDERVKMLKTLVDEEVQSTTNSLQSRKEAIYAQINAWKAAKEKTVNSEIADLVKRQSDLQNVNNQCTTILRGNELVVNREKKIREKVQATLGLKDSEDLMKERITKAIAMATITFDAENTLISNIDSYGIFKENETNPLFEIANITLDEPIKSSDTANGYKVRLKWSTSKEADDVNDFSVRFRLSNSDDDDEKKAVDEWKMAKHGQIEKIENTKFAVNIETEMLFNDKYEYSVRWNVTDPFPMTIPSNVMEFGIDGKPKDDVVELPLQVHSYRKHYDSYHPNNLLVSDSNYYASAWNSDFGPNENDWIIFNVRSDQLYFPTKVAIKNGHSTQDVKTMKIWIGDGGNEWYLFQPSIINVARNGNMQTFDIDGVTTSVIRNKKFRHYKVEFVSNYGCSYDGSCNYCVYEFQLFGVKY